MLSVDNTMVSHSGFNEKKIKENTSGLINPFVHNPPFLYALKKGALAGQEKLGSLVSCAYRAPKVESRRTR